MGENFTCYFIRGFINCFANLDGYLVEVSYILLHSHASTLEGPWLPCVFRVDFRIVLAVICSNIEGWYGIVS